MLHKIYKPPTYDLFNLVYMNDMPANVCDLLFLIDGNVLTNHLSNSLSFLLFKSLKYFKTKIIMQNFFFAYNIMHLLICRCND